MRQPTVRHHPIEAKQLRDEPSGRAHLKGRALGQGTRSHGGRRSANKARKLSLQDVKSEDIRHAFS
eukprot:scaffold20935_cov69-Phaeocystis_antarctica.AAC.4